MSQRKVRNVVKDGGRKIYTHTHTHTHARTHARTHWGHEEIWTQTEANNSAYTCIYLASLTRDRAEKKICTLPVIPVIANPHMYFLYLALIKGNG